MGAAGFARPWSPVDDDKAQTHDHKQEAQPRETRSQYFGRWAERLLFFGYNTNVENGWKNKYEARGGGGTYDSKDAQDVRCKND